MKSGLLALIFLAWLISINYVPDAGDIIYRYWYFFLLGLTGALIANSTGAGGGIVFIPFFTVLGISHTQALSTSILIQSFGMTAGAITWAYMLFNKSNNENNYKQLFSYIALIGGVSSVTGALSTLFIFNTAPYSMVAIFKSLSLIFGALLLFTATKIPAGRDNRTKLSKFDLITIPIITFVGGVITSWVSIGIGEIIALYLIFRHFPILIAIGSGVALSSMTVLSLAPSHIIANNYIWEILLFSAPAALIGGTVARYISLALDPVRLKIYIAIFVIATGVAVSY